MDSFGANLSDPTVRVDALDGVSAESIPYFDFSEPVRRDR